MPKSKRRHMCSQMNCFLWANLVYELGHMILYVHVVSMILQQILCLVVIVKSSSFLLPLQALTSAFNNFLVVLIKEYQDYWLSAVLNMICTQWLLTICASLCVLCSCNERASFSNDRSLDECTFWSNQQIDHDPHCTMSDLCNLCMKLCLISLSRCLVLGVLRT